MNAKFFSAIAAVAVVLSVLIYSAVNTSAKAVVTVNELLSEGESRPRIRLGARVTDDEISYQSQPTREVRFTVRDIQGGDIQSGDAKIPVVYQGVMPDTLKNGRDVILEGNFEAGQFQASSLMTKCPSKYEPPLPGEKPRQAGDYD
jgi:cytochrome c-type biogenesis protein CcmE